jgi:hypothetical protein
MWATSLEFGTIRDAIPYLLKETLPENDHLHKLTLLPMNIADLALEDPVNSMDAKFQASEAMSSHTIQVMRG